MKLKDREKANRLAAIRAKKYRRKASLLKSDLHDSEFHEIRNKYPFYGFVEIHNEGCAPFLMYSNHDDLVAQTYFWYGNDSYERASVAEWILRSKHSNTIFDVGAYTGVYSFAAYGVNPSADIHSFEPTRRVYGRLLANVQLNQLSNKIRLVNRGVSDMVAEVKFLQYRGEHILGAGASFIDKNIEIVEGDEVVKTITIDDYVTELDLSVELIKVDVEEAEEMVVRGMEGVLDRDGPDILIEVTPDTVGGVTDALSRHSYHFFSVDDSRMEVKSMDDPINYLQELLRRSPRDRISCNILAEKQ